MSSALKLVPQDFLPTNRSAHVSRNEARQTALRILRNPKYQQELEAAAVARQLPPAVETMLWHYAYGKPADRIEVGPPGSFQAADLELLSTEQLAERAEVLAACLRAQAEGRTDDALALAQAAMTEIEILSQQQQQQQEDADAEQESYPAPVPAVEEGSEP